MKYPLIVALLLSAPKNGLPQSGLQPSSSLREGAYRTFRTPKGSLSEGSSARKMLRWSIFSENGSADPWNAVIRSVNEGGDTER